MKVFKRLCLGAAALAGCCVPLATAQSAGATTAQIETHATPALWKVKGVHGTVYLFGTVHVMRKEVQWETPKIAAAFKASDTLYLEVPGLDEAESRAAQPLIMKLGIDTDHPLSTRISKDDVAALDAALKSFGAQGGEEGAESMQPWLVYLTLSVLPSVSAGYDPASGIDRVLEAEAKTAKKPIRGFETVEQQIHFLADFPMDQQVALLHEELANLPKSAQQMNEIVADWTRGDVDKIAAIDNGELKEKHPELYEKLLVSRNVHFTDTIQALLKDPATGSVFVAIGAAHLAGAESVNALLQKRGFTVTREQ